MSEKNRHLDEGTIHAWLDGALPPDESARIEAHVQGCSECSALVAEARGLIAASSRILGFLDSVPAGVIPGTSSGTDQLAALRARRAAEKRVWWRDRRFVAAASLVLVAGVSSVVWRSAGNPSKEMQAVAPVVVDRAQPANAPEAAPAPAPAGLRDAPARDAKRESATPSAAPASVAANRPTDTTAMQKVATNAAAELREPIQAKVAPQAPAPALDSLRVLSRADASSNQRQLQQGAAGAAPQRQSFEQQRIDSSRTVTSGSGVSTRDAAMAASMSAGARILDPNSPAGGCYAVRVLAGRSFSSVADTVVLLDMPLPERSDPSWFLARRSGDRSLGSLRWRQVDSTTVELRNREGTASATIFSTTPNEMPTGIQGVTPARALKIRCP